jgi:hypothetical protein
LGWRGRRRAGRRAPAGWWRGHGLELEGEGVDALAKLIDPALKLGRLASKLVQARAEARLGSLDLGQ